MIECLWLSAGLGMTRKRDDGRCMVSTASNLCICFFIFFLSVCLSLFVLDISAELHIYIHFSCVRLQLPPAKLGKMKMKSISFKHKRRPSYSGTGTEAGE